MSGGVVSTPVSPGSRTRDGHRSGGHEPLARVVLLGGASGSGKTDVTRELARRWRVPSLALDDFYRDGDDPVLTALDGPVDWDDPVSWDAEAALAALRRLCREGSAEVPVYDIPGNRRTGTRRLELGGSPVLVAEGIFASELAGPLQAAGLLADAVCLRRNRAATFARRLARDLVEARKPVHVLLARGWRLGRDEPRLQRRWQSQGCRPLDRRAAVAAVGALADGVSAAR